MNSILQFIFLFHCLFLASGQSGLPWDPSLYSNQIIQPVLSENTFSFTEELYIDELVLDRNVSHLFTSRNIKKWLTITNSGDTYLIGIKEKGISFVSIYRAKNSFFQVNELQIGLSSYISCATVFNAKEKRYHKFESYVVVAMIPPSNTFYWYKINGYKLELIDKFTLGFPIKEIKHIELKDKNYNNIVILESSKDNGFIKLYAYTLEKNIPHVWLLESLPLDKRTSSIATTVNDQAILIAAVQPEEEAITLYRYKKNCFKNCQLVQHATINKIIASRLNFFSGYGKQFLAISGSPARILTVNRDGMLHQQNLFRGMTEIMELAVPSKREDVILLGRNSTNVEIFTISPSESSWIKQQLPPCIELGDGLTQSNKNGTSECLGNQSWAGAAVTIFNGQPAIVFPGNKTEIVNVICSLQTSKYQPALDYFWFDSMRQEVEDGWKRFHSGLDSLFDTSPKSAADESWNSVCDMNEEFDRLTQLLYSSRLKLNSLGCTSKLSQFHLAEKKMRNEDNDQNIIISYRDYGNEAQPQESKSVINMLKKYPNFNVLSTKEVPDYSKKTFHPEITEDLEEDNSVKTKGKTVGTLLDSIKTKLDDSYRILQPRR